jgi:hypothetical protein
LLTIPTTFKNDSVIFEWVETVIGDWVSAANTVALRDGSSLRYSVYEVLKSFSFLSEQHRLFAHSSHFDSNEAAYAIDRFVGRNMSSSSMTTAEQSIPHQIDTTNAQQVKDLYSAIGKYALVASASGAVDFSVVDTTASNRVKAVVSVTENLNNGSVTADGKVNGFWEMVQDLARTANLNGLNKTTPLWGVLTDCKSWIFFKVEGTVIQHSAVYNLFNGELNLPEMSDQSYLVCKFLLEIFQISSSLNMKQKSEAVTVYKRNYAEAALITLKDNLRIAQEIKKKDDEITRLKEELAKLKSKPAK